VYVLGQQGADSAWLKDLEGIEEPEITDANTFLQECLAGPAKGYVKYDVEAQQEIVFNIVTVAGVLDAVPLQQGNPLTETAELVFDATEVFKGFSALQATTYVYETYVNDTTTIAMENPGYRQKGINPYNMELSAKPETGLIDFIVKERLFAFFLWYGCAPLTKEHALMERMVASNPWPKPITVYGYNNAFDVFGGDLFEAETTCTSARSMGQVATGGTSNMAYWSSKSRLTKPLLQNTGTVREPFDASKTYVSFIAGDGDNVNFVKGSRRDWMLHRIQKCKEDKVYCFPLVWSLSPHLIEMAPDMARWYFEKSYETGTDYFSLPPSGHLYAYPGEMSEEAQNDFVAATEQDCELFNTSGVVTWEWMGTWPTAIKEYLPKYSKNGVGRGFFPVNVPYPVPVTAWGRTEFFKVVGEKENVVVFKPREWRGGSEDSGSPFNIGNKMYLNATHMAEELNGHPKGTVTAIYMTSDGGLNLDLLFDMVKQLGDHVVIVNQEEIVEKALESRQYVSSEVVV
jgi:hypothetical protein